MRKYKKLDASGRKGCINTGDWFKPIFVLFLTWLPRKMKFLIHLVDSHLPIVIIQVTLMFRLHGWLLISDNELIYPCLATCSVSTQAVAFLSCASLQGTGTSRHPRRSVDVCLSAWYPQRQLLRRWMSSSMLVVWTLIVDKCRRVLRLLSVSLPDLNVLHHLRCAARTSHHCRTLHELSKAIGYTHIPCAQDWHLWMPSKTNIPYGSPFWSATVMPLLCICLESHDHEH